jgi:NlpC/P60 family putative phage cell wall peptidase
MREAILKEAEAWLGTSYQHQAFIKGKACDCAGFVLGVALQLEMIGDEDIEKVPPYSKEWHMHNSEEQLIGVIESFGCTEIPTDEAQPGDIVAFKFGRVTSHLAILVEDNYIIHARQDIGRVCKNSLKNEWEDKLVHAYQFPGVN